MGKVSTHLGSRLVWSVLGCALGAFKIVNGLQHSQIDPVISGLGLVMFGAAWFMQPLLPSLRSAEKTKSAMVGPSWLHSCLIFGGFVSMCIGLALKYGVNT